MERIFNRSSVIKLLKDGLKKPNPKNPKRKMWYLKDLDTPPPGWRQVVEDCEKNPAFPNGYEGIKYINLARLSTPVPEPVSKKIEEKVELTDPKDFPIKNQHENNRTS